MVKLYEDFLGGGVKKIVRGGCFFGVLLPKGFIRRLVLVFFLKPGVATIGVLVSDFIFSAGDYPTRPGVYLMKDAAGKIIYVGKAKSLRARLSSYFYSRARHTPKTRAMVERIAHIDILLAGSEKEALLLEASLIKKHRPRYNVVLRDDKQYVLFRLDKMSEYPRLIMTRNVVRDGSVYFGPFTSAGAAKATWKLLNSVFRLRKCNDRAFGNRVRPCLYYHIGQCHAPCVLDVDRDMYRDIVRRVEMVLSGRTGELVGRLRREMQDASEGLAFERAAQLRDQIRAVEKTVERQAVVMHDNSDRDVLGLAQTENGLGLGMLYVRQGRLLDEKTFFWPGLTLEEGPEVLDSFLSQFYGPGRFIPPVIIVPSAMESEALSEVLSELRGGRVRIVSAASSAQQHLVGLARSVAVQAREQENSITRLLAKGLRLEHEPLRIECIDASHLGGQGMRVGQVVYEDGRRAKGETRLYSFPELEGTGDDYAALAAWAVRRIESGPPWPDLLLIDGGKGQLASVEKALENAGWDNSWELASIAKGPSRRAGELEDRIFRPGRMNPMPLKPGSAELLFLQRVRDDAHRFVIGRQRRARKKRMLDSALLDMPGIGEKTARILWDRFGSLEAMLEATPDQLQEIDGIGRKRALRIHEQLSEIRVCRKSG
ncbi:excinuclease ABC subunit UvrC [Pseudodesulfovibrio senegalensis]|uniref:UvrABC system protein C n=1 Tax=Pseudodesulfovibrio senegalensis TaxID=1721087 RepID=A0A6N6N6U4_9BACT|nr:excinuclease ABC subunit UvrC [Pseudodesulfovibrio senegalensis]